MGGPHPLSVLNFLSFSTNFYSRITAAADTDAVHKYSEPVFTAGGWRIGEGFCRRSRQIFAGILGVWQENAAQNSGKIPQDAVQWL